MLLFSLIWISVFNAIYAQEVTNRTDTDLSFRILNGLKADIKDYPYYAQLSNCGAAIISDQWLATAAHCMESRNVLDYRVWVGGDVIETSELYTFDDVIIHPNYFTSYIVFENVALLHDIALLRLTQRLKFGNTVKALTLPHNDYEQNAVHYFAGRGMDETGNPTKQLMRVDLRTVEPDECLSELRILNLPQYKQLQMNHLNLLKQVAICTKRNDYDVPALCYGDSGSPLVRDHTLFGLTSFGPRKECHLARVGFFTNVAYHVPWITSITGIE